MQDEAPHCGTSLFAACLLGIPVAFLVCIWIISLVRALWGRYGRPWAAWRGDFPQTVEAAVTDFLSQRLAPETRAWLAAQPEAPQWSPPAVVIQQQLLQHYGLASWNRRLLQDCDTRTPEEAARLLLKRVWERL